MDFVRINVILLYIQQKPEHMYIMYYNSMTRKYHEILLIKKLLFIFKLLIDLLIIKK